MHETLEIAMFLAVFGIVLCLLKIAGFVALALMGWKRTRAA